MFLLLSFLRSTFDKRFWQQQLKVSVSWQNFNSLDKFCTWHFQSYCDRQLRVTAFSNRNINLHFSSWSNVNACHGFYVENKTDWTYWNLFCIYHSWGWINHEWTYTKSNHKVKNWYFSIYFLLTLKPFDSLSDIQKDIFQPNKEMVNMEMRFTVGKTFVPTLI